MGNIFSIINGTEVIECDEGFINGIDSINEELILNDENQSITFSTSSEIELGGKNDKCYNFIKDHFFSCDNSCNPDNLEVQIYIECCDKIRYFLLKKTNIEFCPLSCKLSFSLLSNDSVDEVYDCINSRLWFFNYLDARKEFDAIYYNSTVSFVTPFDIVYESYRFLDILNFHLAECGIVLQSTLLNSAPYNNITLSFAGSFGATGGNTIAQSSSLSVIDLLDRIVTLLKGKYIFTNVDGLPTLIVESEGYFKDNNNLVLIPFSYFTTEDDLCIKHKENELSECISMRYYYTTSGGTDFSNEGRAIYDDLLTWGNPDGKTKCSKEILFHSPIFETDGRFKRLDSVNADIPIITIWDGGIRGSSVSGSGIYATTIRTNSSSQDWNYPLYFDQNSSTSLFTLFHYLDSPVLQVCEYESANSSIDVQPNGDDYSFCEFLELLETEGLFFGFTIETDDCSYVIKANQVNIDYDRKVFTLENISFE